MATFTLNRFSSDITAISKLDLSDGPHDFSFGNDNRKLVIDNGESSASITVNLSGENVAVVDIPTLGNTDLSAGLDVVVAAGETHVVDLNEVRSYLGQNGNTVDVTVTGATTGNSFGWLFVG